MDKETKGMIRQMVEQCVREYIQRNPDDASAVIYNDVSELLFDYYKYGEKDVAVGYAIHAQRSDLYFRIIPMYYKDNQTLEYIAMVMGVDISTIVRNKKRLCMEIYKNII